MSGFREELTKAMALVAKDPRVLVLGQSVAYRGHIMSDTLAEVPRERIIEVPVAEELQMGMTIGLALEGYIPVSIFPRLDFMIIATNQLVNHLDKLAEMSRGQYNPKVIIRTMVGSTYPLYSGPQHIQDHSEGLRMMLTNVDVVKLTHPAHVRPMFMKALWSPRSTILVEAPPKREGYEGDDSPSPARGFSGTT